ncbi:MAG TPA: EamA family transporter [Nitrososphaeraceae archaeon]|nr:EamA family transporter [Nitrososphaeraceae archaeon]
MILNQQSKIWLILVSLWIINGSSFIAIKIAIDTIPPLLSAGLRFSISGAILFTAHFLQIESARRKEKDNTLQKYQVEKKYNAQVQLSSVSPQAQITKQQWKHSLVLGLTLFVGGQGLLTWGAQYLSSGITGLLNSTIPLWVAIIGYLIYKERKKTGLGQKLTKSTILGLSAGFGGLMLLVAPSISTGDLSPIGTAALIGSSIAWAIGSIYSSKADLPVSILASSGMIMITGGLMLTAISFGFGEYRNVDLLQVSGRSLAAQIYLIAIITVVGFTDFYWLLRVTSASLANTFAYVSPVIAVLLGWAILHEKITAITIIAMIVILVGVAMMVTKKTEKKRATASVTTS